jgi:putative ABC transport system permease protein
MSGNARILTIAFRNLSRNRGRTAFCLIAIAFATFINVQGASMWEGVFASWRHAAYVYDIGHLRISTREFLGRRIIKPLKYPVIPGPLGLDGLIDRIDALPGVVKAFPRLETEATPLAGRTMRVQVWGLRLGEEQHFNAFNYRYKTDGVMLGRLPEAGRDECMVGKGLAERMQARIGERIPLAFVDASGSERRIDPEIVGVFDFDFFWYDDNYVVLDFGYLQSAAGLGDGTQTISVFVEDTYLRNAARLAGLSERIRELFTDERIVVEAWSDADSVVLTDVRVFKTIITILYAVFNVVAGFLILNTIAMIVIERAREVGLLSALGLGRGSILLTFLLEGVYLGLIGTAMGMVAGGAEAFALSGFPIDIRMFFGNGKLPYTATFYFLFDLRIIAFYGIQSFLVTVLCSVLPALRTLRLDPVEAMRK